MEYTDCGSGDSPLAQLTDPPASVRTRKAQNRYTIRIMADSPQLKVRQGSTLSPRFQTHKQKGTARHCNSATELRSRQNKIRGELREICAHLAGTAKGNKDNI